jgi:hypothetical protein
MQVDRGIEELGVSGRRRPIAAFDKPGSTALAMSFTLKKYLQYAAGLFDRAIAPRRMPSVAKARRLALSPVLTFSGLVQPKSEE